MPGLVPGIHAFSITPSKPWMAGTSPAMTTDGLSKKLRDQIDHLRAGALVHDLGDAAPVAAILVALEAEQADGLTRFHDRDELVHRLDCVRRFQVPGVDLPQRVELARSRRLAAVLRRAELLQVQIGDALLVERGGEQFLGEARLP